MGTAGHTYRDGSSPTVLLVHGGVTDASCWAGEIPALLAAGGAAGEPGVELYVKRDAFPEVLAADLPESVTAVLAVTQRPIAAAALEEKARGAAWRVLPSWHAVAATDQAIHPDAQRFTARRAGARTVEVDASHAVLVSRAGLVADLVRTAAGGAPATPSRLARARGP